jgi:hypothetical protein
MENTQGPAVRHALFGYLADNPQAVSEHSRWLASGGEEILSRLMDSIRGDAFPYTAEQHVQASFGAYVAGAALAIRTLRKLVEVSNNRAETARFIAQAEGAVSAAERAVLLEQYGYTEADLSKYAGRGAPAGKQ